MSLHAKTRLLERLILAKAGFKGVSNPMKPGFRRASKGFKTFSEGFLKSFKRASKGLQKGFKSLRMVWKGFSKWFQMVFNYLRTGKTLWKIYGVDIFFSLLEQVLITVTPYTVNYTRRLGRSKAVIVICNRNNLNLSLVSI